MWFLFPRKERQRGHVNTHWTVLKNTAVKKYPSNLLLLCTHYISNISVAVQDIPSDALILLSVSISGMFLRTAQHYFNSLLFGVHRLGATGHIFYASAPYYSSSMVYLCSKHTIWCVADRIPCSAVPFQSQWTGVRLYRQWLREKLGPFSMTYYHCWLIILQQLKRTYIKYNPDPTDWSIWMDHYTAVNSKCVFPTSKEICLSLQIKR